MIGHTSLQRNKRLVLAYLMERINRIKTMAWEMSYVPHNSKPNLSRPEVDFFSSYTMLMRNYSKNFDTEHFTLDLTDDLQVPPTDLFVEVRVLKDLGEVYTEEGAINLQKGTQHTMRRIDAEPYIRQGALEHKTEHE